MKILFNIHAYLANRLYRYDRQSVLSVFRDMPNFMNCLNPNCDSGQIHGGGDDQPIMTCTTCGFKSCYTHKRPWHTGQTCNEYETLQKEQQEQEKASAELIAKSAKIFPNPKCGLYVAKVSGFDHMTCRCLSALVKRAIVFCLFKFGNRSPMPSSVLLDMPGFIQGYPERGQHGSFRYLQVSYG